MEKKTKKTKDLFNQAIWPFGKLPVIKETLLQYCVALYNQTSDAILVILHL